MALLGGFRAAQMGPGLAAAVCGRLLADVGATVARIDPDRSSALAQHLNNGPVAPDRQSPLPAADLIICEGTPLTLRRTGHDVDTLRRINQRAAIVLISPFGQTGPRAEEPATDLTLFFASGIARMLTGQVDDLDEPPMRPVGTQSAFIGGLAAACAGMHAALLGNGAVIDVSIHEALATLAMTELVRTGQSGKSWSRKRMADGNGATVCILPASDGYAAISPREDRQWASWLEAMGSPSWGQDARFAAKKDRVANWDALHALMSDWSRTHDKQSIAETAQAAHVPSFPLCEPAEHLESAQLKHRGFFQATTVTGATVTGTTVMEPTVTGATVTVRVPGSPFGVHLSPASPAVTGEGASFSDRGACSAKSMDGLPSPARPRVLPLSGVRVLDFSWVIAGPTATRYLAAMGAEVIKIEAPGRGDPGRASELHSVLGQAKKAIVLDLKQPEAIAVAKALAANAGVLVENFATGVMDRLGLGAGELRAINPGLIYVSASGSGRTGPESRAVAYGTLLQCYAGFAGLNRHPDVPPRVGMAWLDPMCGLMLAFVTAAGIWQRRRTGGVARVDFSMIEAMLWTMAEPLLAEQLGGQPAGDKDGVHRCGGPDDWLAAGTDRPISAPDGSAAEAASTLTRAGIPASALARSADLVTSEHLRARGFWEPHGTGVLPGLPWRASFGRANGPAPGLGADTDAVLREVLGMPAGEITRLREAGVLG
jgi:crotonobetainyl-CoA:carnitine CoA-transferase CaiB-like acyl-CoA transferase